MTAQDKLDEAFLEAGTQIKNNKTRLTALEVTAAHNVIGTMKGVFIAPSDPVPVGMPAWGLVVGEQV